jgi:hypothetical protein
VRAGGGLNRNEWTCSTRNLVRKKVWNSRKRSRLILAGTKSRNTARTKIHTPQGWVVNEVGWRHGPRASAALRSRRSDPSGVEDNSSDTARVFYPRQVDQVDRWRLRMSRNTYARSCGLASASFPPRVGLPRPELWRWKADLDWPFPMNVEAQARQRRRFSLSSLRVDLEILVR